jgi:hypothetical protein
MNNQLRSFKMVKQKRQIDKSFHSLLSVEHQSILKTASEMNNTDILDKTIKQVMQGAPNKFHTDQSLSNRVFYDEPVDNSYRVLRAGFIRARPARYP